MPAHVKASLIGPVAHAADRATAASRSAPGRGSTSASTATAAARARGDVGEPTWRRAPRGEDPALAALPDRVALLGEGDRALARVLGDEHRPGDLALALPELLLGPVALLRRGSPWSRRARAGRCAAIAAGELERGVDAPRRARPGG